MKSVPVQGPTAATQSDAEVAQRASESTLVPPAPRRPSRTGGYWGATFVLLLLISAGMVTTPGHDSPASVIRSFYAGNRETVVTAQVLGLIAAFALVKFMLHLRNQVHTPSSAATVTRSGLIIVTAAVLTTVPVLWSALIVDHADDGAMRGAAVASDLTDVALFLAIAAFGLAVAWAAAHWWLRLIALATTVFNACQAGLLFTSIATMHVLAPLSFVALIATMSIAFSLRHRVFGSHSVCRQNSRWLAARSNDAGRDVQ